MPAPRKAGFRFRSSLSGFLNRANPCRRGPGILLSVLRAGKLRLLGCRLCHSGDRCREQHLLRLTRRCLDSALRSFAAYWPGWCTNSANRCQRISAEPSNGMILVNSRSLPASSHILPSDCLVRVPVAATCVRRMCRRTVRGWWINTNASETDQTVRTRGTFPEPLPADDLAGSEPVRRA